jgi:hypothetical protein
MPPFDFQSVADQPSRSPILVNDVVTAATEQLLAGVAIDHVASVAAEDDVVAAFTGRPDGRGITGDYVVAAPTEDGIAAGSDTHHRGTVAEDRVVLADRIVQRAIVAQASDDQCHRCGGSRLFWTAHQWRGRRVVARH